MLRKYSGHGSRWKRNLALDIPAHIDLGVPEVINVNEVFVNVSTTSNIEVPQISNPILPQLERTIADEVAHPVLNFGIGSKWAIPRSFGMARWRHFTPIDRCIRASAPASQT